MRTTDRARPALGYGLRERLFLAFVAISGFAVVAAVVGNYAFYAIGNALRQVTVKSVPPAIAALELAQRTERIVARGSVLLNLTTAEELKTASSALDSELAAADRALAALPTQSLSWAQIENLNGVFDRVSTNFQALKSAVQRRIADADRKAALTRDTFDAYNQFRNVWTPRFTELKEHVETLQRALDATRSSPEQRLAAVDRLTRAMADLAPLEQIQQLAANAFEILVRAAGAATPAELDPIRIEAEEAIRHIDDVVSGLDLDVSFALIVPLSRLRANAIGSASIVAARQAELEAAQEGRSLTEENSVLSVQLSDAVRELVADSERGIETATERTRSVQRFGRVGLAAVVVLSLISSALVGWLYVGRHVVARLTLLSDGMRAIAGGRRDIEIPAGGRDEIAEMARAVEVFRDNAIALDQLLVEREQAAARLEQKVEQRTAELSKSLQDLRTAQGRLVQTEKLASLGQLTAGIAHEIKNPLNFVNNFSSMSAELVAELLDKIRVVQLDAKTASEVAELADMLRDNLAKVVQHGKRADSIVKNMLLHSRAGSGEHRPADINAIVEESLNLAYHGARAERHGFNIRLEKAFDPTAGEIDMFPQEITRVFLNLISNGFYATTKRKSEGNDGATYEPTLLAATKNLGDRVEIRIRDNGTGIPPEVKARMFDPFFTTKPAGEGTGLGLSISHDIVVKQHAGTIEVESKTGEYTEFKITLPRKAAFLATGA
ncbi:MAG: HAMP domain-containing protein [Alphaproteobacteria bacterium]|nr:HAMP domain-containing protein [Alphaproteobacteria bacterium]